MCLKTFPKARQALLLNSGSLQNREYQPKIIKKLHLFHLQLYFQNTCHIKRRPKAFTSDMSKQTCVHQTMIMVISIMQKIQFMNFQESDTGSPTRGNMSIHQSPPLKKQFYILWFFIYTSTNGSKQSAMTACAYPRGASLFYQPFSYFKQFHLSSLVCEFLLKGDF